MDCDYCGGDHALDQCESAKSDASYLLGPGSITSLNYERGLKKLRVWESHPDWESNLRIDPALAWRVLEALLSRFNTNDVWLGQCAEGFFCVCGNPEEYHNKTIIQDCDVTGATLAEALYAAVETLGKEV